MLGENHDLLHELPDHKATIHDLKTTNSHFSRLFDEYHDLDREVRRAEGRVDVITEEQEEMLKRKRLALKDELFSMIQKAEAEGK
ncbi:YdcH family protein [Rhodovibrionaceae bacterium A322]